MTLLEILREARAFLAVPGNWCQGKFDLGSSRCVLGALWYANAEGPPMKGPAPGGYSEACQAVREAAGLASVWKSGEKTLGQWNDAKGRELSEVLAVLDKAIAAEEAKVS